MKQLEPYFADAVKENLRQMKANTDFQLDENDRKNAMNAVNMAQGAENILTARLGRKHTKAIMQNTGLQAKILRLESQLKQLDIDLWKEGISKNDPLPFRLLGRLLNEYIPGKKVGVKSFGPKGFEKTEDVQKRIKNIKSKAGFNKFRNK